MKNAKKKGKKEDSVEEIQQCLQKTLIEPLQQLETFLGSNKEVDDLGFRTELNRIGRLRDQEKNQIRSEFLTPIIALEKSLDNFLVRYYCKFDIEDEFKRVLRDEFFTMGNKLACYNRITKKIIYRLRAGLERKDSCIWEYMDEEGQKEEIEECENGIGILSILESSCENSKNGNFLRNLIEWRNRFAHCELINTGASEISIEYYNKKKKRFDQKPIDEEFKDVFHKKLAIMQQRIESFKRYIDDNNEEVGAWKCYEKDVLIPAKQLFIRNEKFSQAIDNLVKQMEEDEKKVTNRKRKLLKRKQKRERKTKLSC